MTPSQRNALIEASRVIDAVASISGLVGGERMAKHYRAIAATLRRIAYPTNPKGRP